MLVLIGGENENGLKNYALRLASHFPMAITKFANVKNEQKKKKYCCFAKLLNFECVRDALAFFQSTNIYDFVHAGNIEAN